MKAADRENLLYSEGKTIQFSDEEKYMFGYLNRFVEGPSSVLDVGCGTGEISEKLNTLGHNSTGVDFRK